MKTKMRLLLGVGIAILYLFLSPTEAKADETVKIGPNVMAYYNSNLGTLTISGTGKMGAAVPAVYLRDISCYRSYKTEINLGNSNGADGRFYLTDDTDSHEYSEDYYYSGYLEYYYDFIWSKEISNNTVNVIINSGVTNIGHNAFRDFAKLQSVSVAGTVNIVEKEAFRGAQKLRTVNIPNGVSGINGFAFYNCKNLFNITIPGSVRYIGESAFASSGLTKVTLNKGLQTVYAYAFADTCLTTVNIPDGIESIQEYAFPTVSSATIPTNIKMIKENAFGSVRATIHSKNVTITDGAFGSGSVLICLPGSTAYKYGLYHSEVSVQYIPQIYTVSFDGNGGNVSKTSKKVTTQSAYGGLPKPARKGYTFVGWYTKSYGGVQVTSKSTVSATKNFTLYAHWKKTTVPRVSKPKLVNESTRQVHVTFKSVKGAKGYQIRYYTKNNVKKAKTVTLSKRSYWIKHLKKRTYYVQVRAYKFDSKVNKVYGKWSSPAKIKVKK